MLLQFSVSNFRSFKDEQFITMIPAKIKGHEENIAHVAPGLDVLKSAVIYGANASGKSNFVKAFEKFVGLIANSHYNTPGEPFRLYDPFKLSNSHKDSSTKFKVDFVIENVQYCYELIYSSIEVLHEKLVFFPHGREAKYFERIKQNVSYGEYYKGPKKQLEQLIAPNQLFISKAANNGIEELVKIVSYFSNKYSIFSFSSEMPDNTLTSMITEGLFNDEGLRPEKFVKLFKHLDVGIKGFQVTEEPAKVGSFTIRKRRIKTTHNSNDGKEDIVFDIEDESLGTQKLFGLSALIVWALDNGAILIFDELERSLHPHISRFIISLFNNPKINKKNAQLIAATHDVTLLSEENKLRRDQIWIVEKNEQGASQLFSLADMKGVRDNVPFEKWYLSGRFGGVPNIESLQFELDFADEKTENNSNGAH